MTFYAKLMPSPVGVLTLIANDTALVGVLWENELVGRVTLMPQQQKDDHPILVNAERQLGEYFVGERQCFELPLTFIGTPFQQSVWAELVKIPFGETRSYRDIAEQIGNPKAVRAVGAANGKNPISIIAPCHRVIGSNGKLTGFAGGLDNKSRLLTLEQATSFTLKA
ncbi:glycosyltransferase [Enterobacterales bacterium CwR94]|nr:glycosyltransferase [Enterobacterales bacterium CwR94]